MNKEMQSFFNVAAEFGEEFLRRSGNGILDGVKVASRLVGEFATVALATYFAFQLIESQKECDVVDHAKVDTPAISIPQPPMSNPSTILRSE